MSGLQRLVARSKSDPPWHALQCLLPPNDDLPPSLRPSLSMSPTLPWCSSRIASVPVIPVELSRYAGRAGNAQRAADTAVSAAQETAFEASTPRKVPVTPTWSLSTVDNITKWRPCPAGTGSQRRSVSLESWLAGRGRRVLLRVACPGLCPESRLRPEVQLRHSFGGTVKHMLAVRPVFRKEGHWDAPSVWQQDPWAELPMAVTTLSAPPSCGKHTAICGQRLCVTCR